MTKLSVNINKIATLRNARGGNTPNLIQVAKDCERFGAQGITVHPRPDERHIRYADMVMFIYRPEYYGLDVFEDNEPSRGMAEIYIAKNRHGAIAQPRVKFIGQFAKFADVDYVEGARDMYNNQTQPLAPNSDFIAQQQNTVTVQSKGWDKADDDVTDIIKENPNHDIEDPF